jgi:O-antigen/teichoic acid export membrane protein
MIIAPEFYIQLIFGSEFLSAMPVLQIISIAYFIHTIAGPASNMIVIIGKTRLAMINAFIAFLISITANIILIPRIGILGAGIAALISFVVYNSLSIIQIYHYLKAQPFRVLYVKFIAAGLIPAFFLIAVKGYINIYILVLVYFVSYFVVLVLLNAIKEEDRLVWRSIKNRISKKS